MDHFKVFIKFATILLLFYVLVFLASGHVGYQFPGQGSSAHPLLWKVKSYPLHCQGSLCTAIFSKMSIKSFGHF